MINSKMFFRQRNIFILIIIDITSLVISSCGKFDSISNNPNTSVTAIDLTNSNDTTAPAQILDMGLVSNIRGSNYLINSRRTIRILNTSLNPIMLDSNQFFSIMGKGSMGQVVFYGNVNASSSDGIAYHYTDQDISLAFAAQNNSTQNGDFSLTTDLNNIIEIKGHAELRLRLNLQCRL